MRQGFARKSLLRLTSRALALSPYTKQHRELHKWPLSELTQAEGIPLAMEHFSQPGFLWMGAACNVQAVKDPILNDEHLQTLSARTSSLARA